MIKSLSNNVSIDRSAYNEKLDRTFSLGVVADVILDDTHPEVMEISGDVLKDTSAVGAIVVKSLLNWKTRDEQFIVAYPLDRNFINLPVKNEFVEIIQSGTGKAYYRVGFPTINPSESSNLTNLKGIRSWYDTQPVENKSSKYSKVSNTGISQTKGMSSAYEDDNYGKYYQTDTKLHRLQLYEGDLLVESRFGQSIRFSAYDNKDKKWYPCITIRNRENDLSRNEKKRGQITLEDINRDGSIIVMSSLKKVLPFQPGTVDKSNKSNFVTKPISFPNYPKTLDGDQVLVNSGRIILSSKTKEMIFWSKGNTGIISDGHWSWDLAKGITGDIGGNWHVTTNNFDFRVFAGHRGRCILGSGPNLQHIPRGDDLNQWLSELIDLIITNIYYIAPTAPPQTYPGPTNNIPKYLALKARLPRLLSRLNFTGNDPSPTRVGKDQATEAAENAEQNSIATMTKMANLMGSKTYLADTPEPISDSMQAKLDAIPEPNVEPCKDNKPQADKTKPPAVSPIPMRPTAPVASNQYKIGKSVNYDYPLSANFKLGDLTNRCVYPYNLAARAGLTADEITTNLKHIATNILEPLKQRYPGMSVNSGFRDEASIKGRVSQHEKGEAVDLQWPGRDSTFYEGVAKFVRDNLTFDQLIFEHGKSIWLHISLKRSQNNRKEVITMKGGLYEDGIKNYYRNCK